MVSTFVSREVVEVIVVTVSKSVSAGGVTDGSEGGVSVEWGASREYELSFTGGGAEGDPPS